MYVYWKCKSILVIFQSWLFKGTLKKLFYRVCCGGGEWMTWCQLKWCLSSLTVCLPSPGSVVHCCPHVVIPGILGLQTWLVPVFWLGSWDLKSGSCTRMANTLCTLSTPENVKREMMIKEKRAFKTFSMFILKIESTDKLDVN